MRVIANLLLILLITIVVSPVAFGEEVDLQTLIDNANPHDTIQLPSGVYVGNFKINKPIQIRADEEVVLKSNNINEPVFLIEEAREVLLNGLQIESQGTAIEIKNSENLQLENLKIRNVNSGIKIDQSDEIEISEVEIIGSNKHYSKKDNGISLFNSSNITVSNSDISQMQDGIYFENVDQIQMQGNTVEKGRYAIHFMYSKNAVAKDNKFTENVTGVMVMMASDVDLVNNNISYQDGFNGTGITLFDVQNINVKDNKITGNRLAITLQKTKEIDIHQNIFQMNQTAIESIKSDASNSVEENTFVGNLVNVRSDKVGINLIGNYYDDYSGIDIDDNGIGDEAYVALQSFGQWMVEKPVYQYYVEAPSVVLLNELDKLTNKSSKPLLVDESPRVNLLKDENRVKFDLSGIQLFVGLVLLTFCLFIWKRSVQV